MCEQDPCRELVDIIKSIMWGLVIAGLLSVVHKFLFN